VFIFRKAQFTPPLGHRDPFNPKPRHSTAPLLVLRHLSGAKPPHSVDRGPRSTPCRGPCGPSSGFHRRRQPSPSQWWTWGWQLHPWRFHRLGWQQGLAIILQPLDCHHFHVAGSGPQCFPSSNACAGSPN
jgi:hypothetical protein